MNAPPPMVFRVMRLARPGLAYEPCLRVDLNHDMVPDRSQPSTTQGTVLPASLTSTERVQAGSPADAMNLTGFMQLPDSFGRVYLGETFSSYITLNNRLDYVASNIQVKITLETEDEVNVLYETGEQPLANLEPEGHHDFFVKHDLKAVGGYSLVCTVNYTDVSGERKYFPQYFKFPAYNPVSVRTKARQAGRYTFLEASVENMTTAPMILGYVRLLPEEHLTCEALPLSGVLAPSDPTADPLGDYIQTLQVVAPGGCASWLYRLSSKTARPASEVEGLGRLEMQWRRSLGETGLLQTQRIRHIAKAAKDAELEVISIPQWAECEEPFVVTVRVKNNLGKQLDRLLLCVPGRAVTPPTPSGTPRGKGASAVPAIIAGEGNIWLQGCGDCPLQELPSGESQDVHLTLLPLACGLQRGPLIELRDLDRGTLDTLSFVLLVR